MEKVLADTGEKFKNVERISKVLDSVLEYFQTVNNISNLFQFLLIKGFK
jgi:hypothetical protein